MRAGRAVDEWISIFERRERKQYFTYPVTLLIISSDMSHSIAVLSEENHIRIWHPPGRAWNQVVGA